MACPASLGLHQDGVDGGEHLCIWDLVLPFYAKEFPQTCGMEVVQLPGMAFINCPYSSVVSTDADACIRVPEGV